MGLIKCIILACIILVQLYPILADSAGTFGNFSENDISMEGDSSVALNFQEVMNETVSKNTLKMSGENSTAIISNLSTALNFTGNSLSCDGINCKGISYFYSNNSTASNNSMDLSGQAVVGVNLNASSWIILAENAISTINGVALYIGPSENKTYYNHTIENNSEQGKALTYYFSRNDVDILDNDSIGQLYLAFCNNTKVSNVTINLDGITMANSGNATVTNSSLNYTDCNHSGVALINGKDITIENTSVNSSCKGTVEVYLRNATNASFANASYQNVYFFDKKSTLYRYWYLIFNVTDAANQTIGGAEVTCKDSEGNEVFSNKTSASGFLSHLLLEYNQTGSSGLNPDGKTYLTPYKIKIAYNGSQNSSEVELKDNFLLNITLSFT